MPNIFRKTNYNVSPVDKNSSKHFEYIVIFIVCLELVNYGMHFAWSSPAFQSMKNDLNSIQINDEQQLWIILMFPIGMLVISFFYPLLLRSFGRKTLIMMMPVGQLICWILIGYSKKIETFYVGRFIAGMSGGISFAILPTYLGEIVHPKIRGTAISYMTVCNVFGLLLMNVIGSSFSVSATAKICCFGPFIYFFSVLWIPETPYYLIKKGRHAEARKVIRLLRNSTDTNEEFDRISEAVKVDVQFSDFFALKSNRRALIIAIAARLIQHMIGFPPIAFYLQEILEVTGFYISPPTTASTYLLIQIIFSSISLKFADKFGRRPPLIFSTCCVTVALLTVGLFFFIAINTQLEISKFSYIAVMGLFVYIAAFSLGIQQMPGVLVGELFSPQFKGLATGICSIFYCVGIVTSCAIYYFIQFYLGISYAFFAFAVFSIIGTIFVKFCMPETKCKSLEEIQTDLENM